MKSFKELGVDELRRSAIEDFAVDVEPEASKKEIIAAFTETGITWADYVAQHPEFAEENPEENLKDVLASGGVIKSADVTGRVDADAVAAQEEVNVIVHEPVIRPRTDKYLIKMTRENTLFETRGHRFTQENPYALVSGDDADYILSKEDGFRQAFPSELEEFYG